MKKSELRLNLLSVNLRKNSAFLIIGYWLEKATSTKKNSKINFSFLFGKKSQWKLFIANHCIPCFYCRYLHFTILQALYFRINFKSVFQNLLKMIDIFMRWFETQKLHFWQCSHRWLLLWFQLSLVWLFLLLLPRIWDRIFQKNQLNLNDLKNPKKCILLSWVILSSWFLDPCFSHRFAFCHGLRLLLLQ